MKKTRIMGLALAGLLSLGSVAAFADTNRTFSGFTLKANQANNYTTSRAKEIDNDYSYLKCTALKGTTKATLWIADASQKMISSTVDLPVVSSF